MGLSCSFNSNKVFCKSAWRLLNALIEATVSGLSLEEREIQFTERTADMVGYVDKETLKDQLGVTVKKIGKCDERGFVLHVDLFFSVVKVNSCPLIKLKKDDKPQLKIQINTSIYCWDVVNR